MKSNNLKICCKAIAYIVSALLFSFYVLMLVRCIDPQTTDDYRMRYLEDGYFYEQHNE